MAISYIHARAMTNARTPSWDLVTIQPIQMARSATASSWVRPARVVQTRTAATTRAWTGNVSLAVAVRAPSVQRTPTARRSTRVAATDAPVMRTKNSAIVRARN